MGALPDDNAFIVSNPTGKFRGFSKYTYLKIFLDFPEYAVKSIQELGSCNEHSN